MLPTNVSCLVSTVAGGVACALPVCYTAHYLSFLFAFRVQPSHCFRPPLIPTPLPIPSLPTGQGMGFLTAAALMYMSQEVCAIWRRVFSGVVLFPGTCARCHIGFLVSFGVIVEAQIYCVAIMTSRCVTPCALPPSSQDAFWMLFCLLTKYDMEPLFLPGMPGLSKALYVFDRLFKEKLPRLFAHMVGGGLEGHGCRWCPRRIEIDMKRLGCRHPLGRKSRADWPA